MRLERLAPADRAMAKQLFALMALVFEEPHQVLGDVYLERLLARQDFWAIAAFTDIQLVGGLTAHTLPMTRGESSEILIYDLAVRPEHQRQGVGRRLIAELLHRASAVGIDTVFVPADNDDLHAIDFYRSVGGAPAPVTMFTFERR